MHLRTEQTIVDKSTNDIKICCSFDDLLADTVFAVDASAGSAISAVKVAPIVVAAIVIAFDVVGPGVVVAVVVTTFVVSAWVVATFAIAVVVIASVAFTAAVVGWSTAIQEVISTLLDNSLNSRIW